MTAAVPYLHSTFPRQSTLLVLHRLPHLAVFVALLALLLAPRTAHAGSGDVSTVVVAIGATSDVAWSLAQAVYRSEARPTIAESDARALAGDSSTASPHALAELRQAATGEDAPSRALYARILRDTGARQLAFVMRETSGGVVARIYRNDDTIDDEKYFPTGDPKDPSSWSPVVAALLKRKAPAFSAEAGRPNRAPADEAAHARPFYASPWFWGGLAAAALTGGAIYLATRDASSGPIHLQVRLP